MQQTSHYFYSVMEELALKNVSMLVTERQLIWGLE